MFGKKRRMNAAMMLLMSLKQYGNDYDAAEVVLRELYRVTAKRVKEGLTIAEVVDRLGDWLKPKTKRIYKRLWIWEGWRPRVFWVPEENFKDTSVVDLVFANVFFLRFADYLKKHDKAGDEYKRRFGTLMSHLVKRKQWKWRKLKWIKPAYDSDQILKDADLMLKLSPGVQMWLLEYFEDTNMRFVNTYPRLFEKSEEETRKLYSNEDGWISVLFDVAERGIFGEYDKAINTPVHTVWKKMALDKVRAEDQQRQYEQGNR